MEPFEIQPDAFVEKQKEVIAQLTNENILLTCRVEQLEQMLTEIPANQPATVDSFGTPIADTDPEFERLVEEEEAIEREAAERAKDDFPEMNELDPLARFRPDPKDYANPKSWDVT